MRLMISVVSAEEAKHAIEGGAEIIDVKNPTEGSLGAQPPRIIREIRNLVAGKTQISVALGDMPNLPGTAALAALGAASCGVDYIKIGLHGPRTESEAIGLLREARRAVQGFKISVIAAAYADYQRAGTLNPVNLPDLAASACIQGCLLDTAIKDGQHLFAFYAPDTLSRLVEKAHAAGLLIGLAGALREEDLPLIQNTGADIVGVRSAICHNHRREESIDADRVRQLHNSLVPVV
jgi:uncharacterized protein (UPF0264 family)